MDEIDSRGNRKTVSKSKHFWKKGPLTSVWHLKVDSLLSRPEVEGWKYERWVVNCEETSLPESDSWLWNENLTVFLVFENVGRVVKPKQSEMGKSYGKKTMGNREELLEVPWKQAELLKLYIVKMCALPDL